MAPQGRYHWTCNDLVLLSYVRSWSSTQDATKNLMRMQQTLVQVSLHSRHMSIYPLLVDAVVLVSQFKILYVNRTPLYSRARHPGDLVLGGPDAAGLVQRGAPRVVVLLLPPRPRRRLVVIRPWQGIKRHHQTLQLSDRGHT